MLSSRLTGYHILSDEVREGLSEVLSPQFDFQKMLGKFLQHKIESRTGDEYGTGFQLAKRATDMYGLKSTLDYICMTGSFPR